MPKLPDRTTHPADRAEALADAVEAAHHATLRSRKGDPLTGLSRRDRQVLDDFRAAVLAEGGVAVVFARALLVRLAAEGSGVTRPDRAEVDEPGASNPTGDETPDRRVVAATLDSVTEDGSVAITYADPTGDQAGGPDPTEWRRDRLRKQLARTTRELDRLVDLLVDFAPVGQPKAIDPGDLRVMRSSNDRRCCDHCLRVHIAPGVPWECTANVVHGDVGGRLRVKWWLCRACRAKVEESADARSGLGVLPDIPVVEAHRDRTRP